MPRGAGDKRSDTRFAKLAIVEQLVTPSQARELLDQIERIRSRGRRPPSLADLMAERGLITEKTRRRLTARLRAPAPKPPADQPPPIPKRVGRYEILEQIGRGGMGDVYKARQLNMDRVVALKILPEEMARDKRYIRRFIREARAAGALNHPNIVQVYDVGYTHGRYYFSMEYVEGKNCGRLIGLDRRIDSAQAIDIAIQIARALNHAAEHGIVHRDIKPENILVTRDGTAKLADLGLARRTDGTSEESGTRHGVTMGTPYYMSVEQARSVSSCDGRSDIYSLGATLYHMVTGKLPYDGDSSVDILMKAAAQPLVPPDQICAIVPAGLARIIEKMMSKAPELRYQTGDELASDLAEMREALKRGSQGEAIAERIGHAAAARRSPSTALLAVLFVATVASALLIGAILGNRTISPHPPPPRIDFGQDGPETPADTPVQPLPVPEKTPGEAELGAARRFSAENPDRFADALARFDAIAGRFEGSAVGDAAVSEAKSLRDRREEIARRELFRRLAIAEALAADGAYGAAAQAVRLPEPFADTHGAAKAEAEAERMHERAEDDLWRLRRASAGLLAAELLGEAAELWEEAIEVWGIPETVGRARVERDRIRDLMKSEAEARSRAADKERMLQAAMKAVDGPLWKWDFKRAAEASAFQSVRVGSPAHRELLLERKERLYVLTRLKSRLIVKINSMKPHIHTTTFSSRLVDGEVVRADNRFLYVMLTKGAETMIPWHRLNEEDMLNLVRRLTSSRSVTDRLGQAVLHLELGRLASASKLLRRLTGTATEAPTYLEQISRTHTRHAEKAATELMDSARACFSRGDYGECIEGLGKLLLEHSQTKSLASRRAMVGQLVARAEERLIAAGGMGGSVRAVDRGRLKWVYSFDSPGELQDWAGGGERLVLENGKLLLLGGVATATFKVPLNGRLSVSVRTILVDPEVCSLAVRLGPADGKGGGFSAKMGGGETDLEPAAARVGQLAKHSAEHDTPHELVIERAAGSVKLSVDGRQLGELGLEEIPPVLRLDIGLAGPTEVEAVEIVARPDAKWLEGLRAQRSGAAKGLLEQARALPADQAIGLLAQVLKQYADAREECCLAEFEAARIEMGRGNTSLAVTGMRRALNLYPSQVDRHHARIRAELDKALSRDDN